MFINKLTLTNFRNIKKINLAFDNPLTILYGDNGQGKTNIVESIYLLANATSFRTSAFKEMIYNESEQSVVEGQISTLKNKNTQKIVLTKNGKAAFVNEIPITKFSEYIGKFNAVCFSPEDVSLFKDSPGIRRHFLDKELSSLFPIYVKQLIAFKKILEERNMLLKKKVDTALLEVLNDKLIETSYDVYKRRKWLLDKIIEFATKIYKQITDESQQIKIVYQTFLEELDEKQYYIKATKIYDNCLNKDLEKTFTTIGIHKDDFKVYLNDMQIDMYASQGQQRLISLCMKLAVSEIITKATKEEPILILDDAFSELDIYKKRKLFNYVSLRKQVFITCTNYTNIIDKNNTTNITLLNIQAGNVVERGLI